MEKKYVQLIRSKETEELMKKPYCFMLLSHIALRAKRTNDFSVHNLVIGEALIGDYRSIGLTEQKYRTAKKLLEKWKFITIKSTNKGTIAKLIDKRIFNINEEEDNDQTNDQSTINQRSINDQSTTNNNVIIKEDNNILSKDKISKAEKSKKPKKENKSNSLLQVEVLKNTESSAAIDKKEEYGNKDINSMLESLKMALGIDGFGDASKKLPTGVRYDRAYAKHLINLFNKIGREEFLERLKALKEDDFKCKNLGKIRYLYNEMKSYVKPKQKENDQLIFH